MRIDVERGLFLVADGMGGHGHGDVASRVAVEAIVDHMEQAYRKWDDGENLDETGQRPVGVELKYSILAAHRSVVGAVAEDQTLAGMGTTVVGLAAATDSMVVAHVGDSRAYRLRQGQMELMTEDHTWVNEQVRAGYLSPDQARSHPLKSVVTRAVGGDHQVQVDLSEIGVDDGDVFLVCSDGLTTMLTDDEIYEQLMVETGLEERCHGLVDLANEKGGVDNITVILVEIGPDRLA